MAWDLGQSYIVLGKGWEFYASFSIFCSHRQITRANGSDIGGVYYRARRRDVSEYKNYGDL